ncbi:hypothetical protein [uncultured Pedobacter sp.]|uniref:hypothetical protein n=1 Tax=uncultured Pedobacter sp. TaxID=246139 RepID=UPI0025D94EAA|nr:hypothetical protein [uncultured Pedobacter sp.]
MCSPAFAYSPRCAPGYSAQSGLETGVYSPFKFAGKAEIIPGFTNLISVYANRILPKGFIEKMAAGIYKT